MYRKHFDIYDYYYSAGGKCLGVAVNGTTIVDYAYDVDDSSLKKEEGQFINRITYADGYTEEQIADKYGNAYYKYANGNSFYSVYKDFISKHFSYYEGELNRTNTLSLPNENSAFFTQREEIAKETFTYNIIKEDDKQTVTELHYGKDYQTIAEENKVTYISPSSTVIYSIDGNENLSTQKISIDDTEVLISNVSYDVESDTLTKSYGENLSFYSVYDDDGNIISDEKNSYTYNELGELISTSGLVNASYLYDNRGNITSKTVNGEATTYSYDNDWIDQLTSVNGVLLTYDANGNLASYGDTTYTWSHGKQLESITDSENQYSYKYNSSGYRISKTVNGYVTKFDTLNGLVLAQSGRDGDIYFQYKGNAPVGFILDDVQYFYITNNSGDVVGIADENGNVIATYTYDEWGKLLSIETAEENNAQQLEIAETNPLRYRGYYYDNETGYYYLQSRYYDPELGRFISADDFSYINPRNPLNVNAYAYCINNPISRSDVSGHQSENDNPNYLAYLVVDIINSIFLLWDVMIRDFGDDMKNVNAAALLASQIVIDRSVLRPSGNTPEDRNSNFLNWFESFMNDVTDFMNTSFYKISTYFREDFFFTFFEKTWKEKSDYLTVSINKSITISFGIGANDVIETLIDLSNGRFKFFDSGNVSAGIIFKNSTKGIYIEKAFELVGNFFATIGVELDIDDFDFPDISNFFNNLNFNNYEQVAIMVVLFIIALVFKVPVYA